MSGGGANLVTLGVVTILSAYAAIYALQPAFEQNRRTRLGDCNA